MRTKRDLSYLSFIRYITQQPTLVGPNRWNMSRTIAPRCQFGAHSVHGSGVIPVFVAMPFREREEPTLVDYWHAMQRAAEGARRDFNLVRLDEVDGDYEIVDRIHREIAAAHLVIADLTLLSENVIYEMGYARGRQKPVIQVCRSGTRLPFDVRNWRTLVYENATMLEQKLLRELDTVTSSSLSSNI